MSLPNELLYTEEHEWVVVDGDTATVGISAHAANELGDITFVEIPDVGLDVSQGDVLTAIESVKAASDVYSPIGGTVAAVNESLEAQPEIVNDSPEQEGWICKLHSVTAEDLENLMTEEAYLAYVKDLKS